MVPSTWERWVSGFDPGVLTVHRTLPRSHKVDFELIVSDRIISINSYLLYIVTNRLVIYNAFNQDQQIRKKYSSEKIYKTHEYYNKYCNKYPPASSLSFLQNSVT